MVNKLYAYKKVGRVCQNALHLNIRAFWDLLKFRIGRHAILVYFYGNEFGF